MNKERRAELNKASKFIDRAKDILETVKEEEQDYFDNMPESIQGSKTGARAEEVVSELEAGIDQLEDVVIEIVFARSNHH